MALVLFGETFDGFLGAGFAPVPGAGALDSDFWRVTGLSDGAGTFGGTHTTGDFARGSVGSGAVGTAGVYSADLGGGDRALMVQPAGTDFTPGAIELTFTNGFSGTLTDLTVDYVVAIRNDEGRSSTFALEYAIGGGAFQSVAGSLITSTLNPDALGYVSTAFSFTLTGFAITAGDQITLRWIGDDVSGAGSRDQFALNTVEVSTTDERIAVTTLDDIVDASDGLTSLREALALANATAGEDTIVFAADLAGGVIRLVGGELAATESVVIDAIGVGITVTGDVNGDDALLAGTAITDVAASAAAMADNTRVLLGTGADTAITLRGLTITGGYTTSRGGAGISSEGALVIEDSTVAGNWANVGAFLPRGGGGIWGGGAVTITDSTISGNLVEGSQAQGGGVRAAGDLVVTGSTVSGNFALDTFAGNGGGLSGGAAVTVTDSTVSGNRAAGEGGGIHTSSPTAGALTVRSSVLTGNLAGDVGDAIAANGLSLVIEQSRIEANGIGENLVFPGNPGPAVHFDTAPLTGGTVSVVSSTISGNAGLGFYADGDTVMVNTTVSGNLNAGIRVAASLDLIQSTVTGNSSTAVSGTGVGVIVGNGAIGPVLTMTNSIVSGNSALTVPFGNLADVGFLVGATSVMTGGNIVGGYRFDGSSIAETGLDAADIFAVTTEVLVDTDGDGVGDAPTGRFGGGAGPTGTVALLAGGAADGGGDAALLPADFLDLDGDTDTAEPLPQDADGRARIIAGALDLGAVEAAEEASLVVTTALDVVDAFDGLTSLREAVAVANGTAGADTITFDAGLAGATLRLVQGAIGITEALTIDAGALAITVSGDAAGNDTLAGGVTDVGASAGALADNTRLFEITGSGSATTFAGLTLTGGRTGAAFSAGDGGAVRSAADLTFTDSRIAGNTTEGSFAAGGAINTAGRLTLVNTTLEGNLSRGNGGGAAAGSIEAISSTISGNRTTGNYASGGGLWTSGAARLVNVTLAGNSTSGTGGNGAGISTFGDLTVISSTIHGNIATGFASTGGGAFTYNPYGTATQTLRNSIVTGNSAAAGGASSDISAAASVTRVLQGGNIVNGALSQNGVVSLSGLGAADIFAVVAGGLGVLADNGGAVRTLALSGASAARGQGDAALLPPDSFDLDGDLDTAEALPLDAAGGPRVAGALDLGAFEVPGGPIIGTPDPDTLVGTVDGDEMFGLASADTLSSLGGNDTLYGGEGNDLLAALQGNDTLYGGEGNDTLAPFTGTDIVYGGAGDDLYFLDDAAGQIFEQAGEGFDTVNTRVNLILPDHVEAGILRSGATMLRGNALGNRLTGSTLGETLEGMAGNDTLYGGAGTDTLFGGADADTLDGGTGADTMTGGAGDDVYFRDNALDVIVEEAGGGYDRVYSSLSSLALAAGVEEGILSNPAFSLSLLFGNELDNVLRGNAGRNVIEGSLGNDYLLGGGDIDQLDGGTGNDTLDGGTGADTMTGREGDDLYFVDDAADLVLEEDGEGTDRVIASITYVLDDVFLEHLTLTGAAIGGTGNLLDNVIRGNALNNILSGLEGNDHLLGADGTDMLEGGEGNDILDGGTGADTMTGGAGDDAYFVDNASDVVIELAGGGRDRVNASVSHTLANEVEELNLSGSAGQGFGNGLGNVIRGGTASEELRGLGGDDTIFGNGGQDFIVGGEGSDVLVGGAGRDRFLFDSLIGADRVLDFAQRSDLLLLDTGVFTELTLGFVSPFQFVVGPAALDGDDLLIYDAGRLFYDADGNGAGAAVLFVTLSGAPTISSSDFMLF